MKFISINNEFRDTLLEALDRNNEGKKVRPYYLGIKFNSEYFVLLPLRSNCPRSYSIKIRTSKKEKTLELILVK